MLTKQQREKLRNIRLYKFYSSEENGIPVEAGEKVILPTWVELKKNAVTQILKNDFSKVDQVSPTKANCIIRIFCKFHCLSCMPGDEIKVINLYGFKCFTKESNKWISNSGQKDKLELDFSRCKTRQRFRRGGYVDYDCDFFDLYVKVS